MVQRYLLLIGSLIMFLPTAVTAAQTMYVQSYKATIYQSPSFSSKIVGQTNKGVKVLALAKRNNWLQIQSGSQRGWVMRHTLSKRPPVKKVSFFDNFLGLFKSGSVKGRKRASVVSATVGVRGLTEEEKRGMDQDVVAAYEAVDKMELLTITETELASFIEAR